MYIDQKYLREPVDYDEIPEKLPTIWGTAKIDDKGYWRITTSKEGYYMKLVHRLIYEYEHKVKILSDVVVHHIDENPLNNNINNLELMFREEHIRLHKKGVKLTDEHKQHISESLKKNFPRKKQNGSYKGKIRYAAVDHEGKVRKTSYSEEEIDEFVELQLIPEWKYAQGFL